MNFHSDEWIMEKVREHYNDALGHFPEDRIVGIFYQGSGNYGLDTPTSDVDTKLIVTPTFRDLAMNKQPISTTHIRENDEHIDFKDVRLYCQTFRKQNLNFLEILFTPYAIINPIYKSEWGKLVDAREQITHYDPMRAIQSMRGVAHTKYRQLENESPSHMEALEKFGYSPKELHHLLRVEEYIGRYLNGESYADCLKSKRADYLKDVKNGHYDLATARIVANTSIDNIDRVCDAYLLNYHHGIDKEVNELIDNVQYNIMEIAIEKEFNK